MLHHKASLSPANISTQTPSTQSIAARSWLTLLNHHHVKNSYSVHYSNSYLIMCNERHHPRRALSGLRPCASQPTVLGWSRPESILAVPPSEFWDLRITEEPDFRTVPTEETIPRRYICRQKRKAFSAQDQAWLIFHYAFDPPLTFSRPLQRDEPSTHKRLGTTLVENLG